MHVFQFFITCRRTNNANDATHYVKIHKSRRKRSKRNYFIIVPRVMMKAIIIMRHENNVKHIMPAQLARTLEERHCNSFTDLIDEMELWDCNVANQEFWSRLAKSLHSQEVSVTWVGKWTKNSIQCSSLKKMRWATATRSIQKCIIRIAKNGGLCVDTWSLDAHVWNALWTGLEARVSFSSIYSAHAVGERCNFLTLAMPLLSVDHSSRPFQSTRFRYSCVRNWMVR